MFSINQTGSAMILAIDHDSKEKPERLMSIIAII